MTFLLNLVGFIASIAGAAWLASLFGLLQAFVLPAAGVLLAIAVVIALLDMRIEDPA